MILEHRERKGEIERDGAREKQSDQQRPFNNKAAPGEVRSRAEQHSETEATITKRIDALPLDRDSSE